MIRFRYILFSTTVDVTISRQARQLGQVSILEWGNNFFSMGEYPTGIDKSLTTYESGDDDKAINCGLNKVMEQRHAPFSFSLQVPVDPNETHY
jgi:hypothetical protein